jgi:WhiB family redox-sensing transcriptional regulator
MANTWHTGSTDQGSTTEELLDLLVSAPGWHADAACQEHPDISWFPEVGQSSAPAKAVCRTCLVAAQCLEWALGEGSKLEGIWGGTTTRERRTWGRRAVA